MVSTTKSPKTTQKKRNPPNPLCEQLVHWLESLKKDWNMENNESGFERKLGVPRNTLNHLRDGSIPKLDKVILMIQGAGIEWNDFGKVIGESEKKNQGAGEIKDNVLSLTIAEAIQQLDDRGRMNAIALLAKQRTQQPKPTEPMSQEETARDLARGREREIAELLEVDLQVIYEWTNSSGKTLDIPPSKTIALADFLGVGISPDDIMEDIIPSRMQQSSNVADTEEKMESVEHPPLENEYH